MTPGFLVGANGQVDGSPRRGNMDTDWRHACSEDRYRRLWAGTWGLDTTSQGEGGEEEENHSAQKPKNLRGTSRGLGALRGG